MAEIGIIWVAVAYFTRRVRATLRLPMQLRRSYVPAHLPLRGDEVELATVHHEMVIDSRTGERPLVLPRLVNPDWTLANRWCPPEDLKVAGTPIAYQLTEPAPLDPEVLDWLEDFTGSWQRCGDGYQLVGATS